MSRGMGELPSDGGYYERGDGVVGPVVLNRSRGRPAVAAKLPPVNRVAMINRGFRVNNNSRRVLPANPKRMYLIIINTSTIPVYVSFSTDSDIGSAIPIQPGGNYEPWVTPYSEVYLRASINNGNASVVIGEGHYESDF